MMNPQAMRWDVVLLSQNPFPNTPPRRSSDDIVWAGFADLKRQFEDILAVGLTTSATQVVLNWGEYGSGKTHSAMYFGRPSHWPAVDAPKKVKDTFILYVQTAKVPEEAENDLYRKIIEAIRFRRIRSAVKDTIAVYGQDSALEKLQDAVDSEVLGKAIWLLGTEERRSGQLSLFDDDSSDNDWHRLLETYFYSGNTRTDLKRLGLSRGIDSVQDRFQILGGLLQCLIGFAPTREVENHNRILLWMDELEGLITYPTRYHRPFTQGLRDLIDRLPSYLTLLMNVTLASPDALDDIKAVLGQALIDRVSHQIYFREPNVQEAFIYVADLLKAYRTEEPRKHGLPHTYPFDEEALRMLISNLPSRTPRDINQRCTEVISKALQQGVITKTRQMIAKDFVLAVEEARIEADMG